MKTYIALLRGINVGGHRKTKMIDLKAALNKTGLKDVTTYIQSGNVVFKSSENNTVLLENRIKESMAKTFGFDIPVLITDREELIDILDRSPFKHQKDIEANNIYYVLLKSKPGAGAVTGLDQDGYPNELFEIMDNCVYLNCLNGAGKAKLNNNIIEQKLGVEATTRNHRTLLKLIELSSE